MVRCAPMVVLSAAALAAVPTTPPPASGVDPARRESVRPADVLARVKLVAAEVEQLRFEMGRPRAPTPHLRVREAASREVYFQARELYRRADRLCTEQTGSPPRSLEAPRSVDALSPGDVWHVVDATLQRLVEVRVHLGLSVPESEAPQPANTQRAEVFLAVVAVAEQLDVLLDTQLGPVDVYQQLTQAIHYVAPLLATFPNAPRVAELPAFERGRSPADVFRRLVEIFKRLRHIADLSGVEMLSLDLGEGASRASPADSHGMAALLVSELAWLHGLLAGAAPAEQAWRPGRKFPSHVYQRAGQLDALLAELEKQVQLKPGWLGR